MTAAFKCKTNAVFTNKFGDMHRHKLFCLKRFKYPTRALASSVRSTLLLNCLVCFAENFAKENKSANCQSYGWNQYIFVLRVPKRL